MENFYILVNNDFAYIQKILKRMGYGYCANYTPYLHNGILPRPFGIDEFAIIIKGKFIVGIVGKYSPRLDDLKKMSVEDLTLVET